MNSESPNQPEWTITSDNLFQRNGMVVPLEDVLAALNRAPATEPVSASPATAEEQRWQHEYGSLVELVTQLRQQLAAMTAERDEANRYAERLRGAINGIGPKEIDYAIAIEKDRDRLAAAASALLPFASHKNDCLGLYSEMGSGDTTCTCGYEAARDAAARGAKP